MQAEYRVTDASDGLIVKVTMRRSMKESALYAGLGAAACAILVHQLAGSILIVSVTSAAVGIVSWVIALQEKRASLQAQNLEFSVSGIRGEHYQPQTISRADIQELVYRRYGRGSKGKHNPPGLYASGRWLSVCIVPYVSEQQANEIIALIYRRFPDMPLRKVSLER